MLLSIKILLIIVLVIIAIAIIYVYFRIANDTTSDSGENGKMITMLSDNELKFNKTGYGIINIKLEHTYDIKFSLKTNHNNGLLMMIGTLSTPGTPNSPFLSIGLINGKLSVTSNGTMSKPLRMVSSLVINNNIWHSIEINRNDRNWFIKIDDENVAYGISNNSINDIIQTDLLYIGGHPSSISSMTGFTGCIKNVIINNNDKLPIKIIGKIDKC